MENDIKNNSGKVEKIDWVDRPKKKRFNYMWVLPYIEKMEIGEARKITLVAPYRHFPAAVWYMYRREFGTVRAYRCWMFRDDEGRVVEPRYSFWVVKRIQSEEERERELDQTEAASGVPERAEQKEG